ncbi:MAG: hypothetical protein KF716_15030 [Anaerolineae bacterium]|nr:hypothetical protein [Anaerolineae bacterium]
MNMQRQLAPVAPDDQADEQTITLVEAIRVVRMTYPAPRTPAAILLDTMSEIPALMEFMLRYVLPYVCFAVWFGIWAWPAVVGARLSLDAWWANTPLAHLLAEMPTIDADSFLATLAPLSGIFLGLALVRLISEHIRKAI